MLYCPSSPPFGTTSTAPLIAFPSQLPRNAPTSSSFLPLHFNTTRATHCLPGIPPSVISPSNFASPAQALKHHTIAIYFRFRAPLIASGTPVMKRKSNSLNVPEAQKTSIFRAPSLPANLFHLSLFGSSAGSELCTARTREPSLRSRGGRASAVSLSLVEMTLRLN